MRAPRPRWLILPFVVLLLGALGPWSPLAPRRAAALLADNQPARALDHYLRAAVWQPRTADRVALLREAALIAAVALQDPARADALLAQAAGLAVEDALAAEVLAQRAAMQEAPEAAADLWLLAATRAPTHPEAPMWRLLAGQRLLAAGDVAGGLSLLEAVAGAAGAPPLARQVWGRALLEHGDVAAACAVLVDAGLLVCDGITDSDGEVGEGALDPASF